MAKGPSGKDSVSKRKTGTAQNKYRRRKGAPQTSSASVAPKVQGVGTLSDETCSELCRIIRNVWVADAYRRMLNQLSGSELEAAATREAEIKVEAFRAEALPFVSVIVLRQFIVNQADLIVPPSGDVTRWLDQIRKAAARLDDLARQGGAQLPSVDYPQGLLGYQAYLDPFLPRLEVEGVTLTANGFRYLSMIQVLTKYLDKAARVARADFKPRRGNMAPDLAMAVEQLAHVWTRYAPASQTVSRSINPVTGEPEKTPFVQFILACFHHRAVLKGQRTVAISAQSVDSAIRRFQDGSSNSALTHFPAYFRGLAGFK